MKQPARSVDVSSATCRELTLREVRALPRIRSGYVTDRVYRLHREVNSQEFGWRLREERLGRPLEKQYDDGDVDDWLDSYQEAADPGSIRFMGAFDSDELVGLVTWTHSRWNNTLWLADIRVKTDRQRTGAGSLLMQTLQHEAGSAGTRGIRLETQITNYPAIRFYQKHGFQPSGLDDHLYSNRDLDKQDIALFLFWERT